VGGRAACHFDVAGEFARPGRWRLRKLSRVANFAKKFIVARTQRPTHSPRRIRPVADGTRMLPNPGYAFWQTHYSIRLSFVICHSHFIITLTPHSPPLLFKRGEATQFALLWSHEDARFNAANFPKKFGIAAEFARHGEAERRKVIRHSSYPNSSLSPSPLQKRRGDPIRSLRHDENARLYYPSLKRNFALNSQLALQERILSR
jgi:hypothetical protein